MNTPPDQGSPALRRRHPDSIVKNAASTFVAQMTTASLTAALTLFLVRELGAKQYGVFALTVGMSSIAVALADLGVSDSTARFVAEHRGREAGLGALVADALKLKVVTTGLLCALFAALASVIAAAYGNHELVWPLRAIALATFGQSTYALLLGVSTALGRAAVNVRLVAVESVVEVSASVALVLIGTGAAGAAFGRAIGYVFGAAVAAYVVLRLSGHERGGFWHLPQRETVRRVSGYAGPMFALDVSYTFSTSVTVLLVGGYLGSAASGTFQAPLKLIILIQYVGLSTASGVAPRLARGQRKQADIKALNGALRGLIGFQCITLAPAVVWARPITRLLLGSGYGRSADVLAALAPYIFFCGLVPLVTTSVTYLGEAARRLPIAFGTLALIVGCGVVLIPSHGVVGAAIATDIAFGFYTLAHLWLCRRLLQLQIGMLIWSLASGLTAAGAMGIVLASVGTSHLTVLDWLEGGVGGLAAFVAMMIFTREIRREHILRVTTRVRALSGTLPFVSSRRPSPEPPMPPIAATLGESPDVARAASLPSAPAASAMPSVVTRGDEPPPVQRGESHPDRAHRPRRGLRARRRDRSRPVRPVTDVRPGARPQREDSRSPAASPPEWVEGFVAEPTGQVDALASSPATQPPSWLGEDLGENPLSPIAPGDLASALEPARTASTRDIVYQIAWRLGEDAGVFELQPVDPSDASHPANEHSTPLTWGWRMPPAPILEARRAHDALVERLLVAGWRRAGVGDAWFEHRFRSPAHASSEEVHAGSEA